MAAYLVTGGAGFIGSHMVERLILAGHHVRVLDDFSTGRRENLEGVQHKVEVVEGDLRDRPAVRRAMQGVEWVIHAAAWRSVPKSMEDPCGYTEVNVGGTVNVLEEARAAKVTRVVFASSSSVYGNTDRMPLREDQPVAPISPYALSKWCGEECCRLFARSYGLETVSLRYFNVFGPRQSLDNEYAVVIPKFITCLLRGEPPPVFGDGRQSRDFTYVDNVVEATLAAIQRPGVSGEVFNVALGRDHSLLELLEELKTLTGSSAAPAFKPPRPGDVRRTLGDPAKATQQLGWEGRVGFSEGLRRTVAWFQHAPAQPT